MKRSDEIASRKKYDMDTLKDIMALLRSDDGCPWDREQDHKSIRKDFIEETYEAVDAIDRNDPRLLCEELGDVLLQVVFHAQIEAEAGNFTLDDVINGICEKLIRRHPHVFGDAKFSTGGEVLESWDKIKKAEKIEERRTVTDELNAIPAALPALMRAQKVGKKAGKAGFDFNCADDALMKVYEEADEVGEILKSGADNRDDRLCEEIGDLLLSVTNTARFVGVDCEEALNRAINKFIHRFEKVESAAANGGKSIFEMPECVLNDLWNEAKKQ